MKKQSEFLHLNVRQRLSETNLILIVGLFLSQTSWMQYLTNEMHNNAFSILGDIVLIAMTIGNILAILSYMLLRKFSQFNYFYEFISLPLFSVIFLNMSLQGSRNDFIWIFTYLVGVASTIAFIVNFYTKIADTESQSILKITIKYRIFRILRFSVFNFFLYFGQFTDFRFIYGVSLSISLIQLYYFLTAFIFQDPYKQFIFMIASITSILSNVDILLYSCEYSHYSFIGQIFMIASIIFQFGFLVRALQNKYLYFTSKNIKMRDQFEMLGVACMLKQVIFYLGSRKFNYSEYFIEKMTKAFLKMIEQPEIQLNFNKNKNVKQQCLNLNQDHINFIQMCQNRFKNSQHFIICEFYWSLLIRSQQLYLKNRVMQQYYFRVQNMQNNASIFVKIQLKIVYQNLLHFIKLSQFQKRNNQIMKFCEQLRRTSSQMITLCKNQIFFMNSLANFDKHQHKFFEQLIGQRSKLREDIDASIDNLINNQHHINSGNFLFICILYKLTFCRQVNLITEKLLKHFIIPLSLQSKLKYDITKNEQNVSIVVCCGRSKGLIQNQNQHFTKLYGNSIQNKQESKKYINQLFPSTKQSDCHQILMTNSQKYLSAQQKQHHQLDCYIRRKIPLSSIQQFDKNENENEFINQLQKVIITARIYVNIQHSMSYLCTIQQTIKNYEGIKVLEQEIKQIKKQQQKLEIKVTEQIQQLNENMNVCHIESWQLQANQQLQDYQPSLEKSLNVSQKIQIKREEIFQSNEKFKKIQKQLDYNKYHPFYQFYGTIVLILSTCIIYLSIEELCGSLEQNEFEKNQPFLDLQRNIFKQSLMAEKRIGLSMMILKLSIDGAIPLQFCNMYGVWDMKQYIKANLHQYVSNNFDSFEHQLFKQDQNDQNIDLFSVQRFPYYQTTNIPKIIDYSQYVSMIKSFVFDNLNNLESISEMEQEQFNKYVIRSIQSSTLDENSFFNYIKHLFQENSKQLLFIFDLILVGFIFITVAVFLIFKIILFRILKINYLYVSLLKKITKTFTFYRNRRMNFIIEQINKINKNQLQDISLNKNMEIHFTNSFQTKTLDFEDLDQISAQRLIKSSQMNFSPSNQILSVNIQDQEASFLNIDSINTENQKKIQIPLEKISYWKVIWSNKIKFLSILVVLLALASIHCLEYKLITDKVNTNIQFERVVDEMVQLFESMNNLLISQWINYSDKDAFSNSPQNQIRQKRALQILKGQSFKETIHQLFSEEYKQKILYGGYCQKAPNVSQCLQFQNGMLRNGLSFLIQTIAKNFQTSKLLKNFSSILYGNQLCQKTVIAFNYTFESFITEFNNGFQSTYHKYQLSITNVTLIKALTFCCFIIFITAIFYFSIDKSIKIQSQILSIDSAQNLYQNIQSFKPYLNQLYYKIQRQK